MLINFGLFSPEGMIDVSEFDSNQFFDLLIKKKKKISEIKLLVYYLALILEYNHMYCTSLWKNHIEFSDMQ